LLPSLFLRRAFIVVYANSMSSFENFNRFVVCFLCVPHAWRVLLKKIKELKLQI